MPHDVDLECISISSFEDEMAPPTTNSSLRGLGSESWETYQDKETPIFGETVCNISKNTKLS